jgi:hypothetical protein
MSGIERFLKRAAVQTVVYWSSPVEDGYGGFTYADPVEIEGRWENVQEVVRSTDGSELLAQARCWVEQDVDEKGYLFLGTLNDLDSAGTPDNQEGAVRIIAFSKIPALHSTNKFIRKASLNKENNER